MCWLPGSAMIPGTVMFVYLGSLSMSGAGHRQLTTGEWVLVRCGLLAVVTYGIGYACGEEALGRRSQHRDCANLQRI